MTDEKIIVFIIVFLYFSSFCAKFFIIIYTTKHDIYLSRLVILSLKLMYVLNTIGMNGVKQNRRTNISNLSFKILCFLIKNLYIENIIPNKIIIMDNSVQLNEIGEPINIVAINSIAITEYLKIFMLFL